MRMTARLASLILAATLSLGALSPALADGHRDGRREHGHGWGYGVAQQGQDIQAAGNALTITQNGNGNSANVLQRGQGGGATTITQNGNNNSVTVIQITGRGHGGFGRDRFHRD